jgi:hypothetical protein
MSPLWLAIRSGQASRSGRGPVLFHKGHLTEASATDLSPAVREAIRHAQQRVLAVVLNAVDHHLSKSDQLRLSWTLAQFQHLDALLFEAQLAHRIVVITSDHGQVLDEGMSRAMAGETERWRVFSGELVEGEAVFEGPRVERATGFPCIIAAWSEVLRYSQKKHGYHGSATPQEVLVPIGVFVRSDGPTEGCGSPPQTGNPPGGAIRPTEVLATPPRQPLRRSQSAARQASFFTGIEASGTEQAQAQAGSTMYSVLPSSRLNGGWLVGGLWITARWQVF